MSKPSKIEASKIPSIVWSMNRQSVDEEIVLRAAGMAYSNRDMYDLLLRWNAIYNGNKLGAYEQRIMLEDIVTNISALLGKGECAQNNLHLFAFWPYDLFPFWCGGTVTKILEEGRVETKEYGPGHSYNPAIILPLEEGKEKKAKLDAINLEHRASLEEFNKKWSDKVDELMSCSSKEIYRARAHAAYEKAHGRK